MMTKEEFKNIIDICASMPDVKEDVFKNHDNNMWWPLEIEDYKKRLLIAGLSTRISYNMINSYRKVINKLNEYSYEQIKSMTKEEMLDARVSAMNHAMVFTGVNLVDDKPTRWKIENSWGDQIANKGFFICSDTWFDKYVYEAAINKKYLTDEQRKALEDTPSVLEPWDPFGSLAD